MSLIYQLLKTNTLFYKDEKWLIPLLNNLYDIESNNKKIIKHIKYNLNCEYVNINSANITRKNVKNAIGFGVCFQNTLKNNKRIILFRDLLPKEYTSIGVAHEYAHLIGGDEKEAFTLELFIAKTMKKEIEYLNYNKKEYPWRIRKFKEFYLI